VSRGYLLTYIPPNAYQIEYYRLEISTTDSFHTVLKSTICTSGQVDATCNFDEQLIAVYGLEKAQHYFVRMRAGTIIGDGQNTSIVETLPITGSPGPPHINSFKSHETQPGSLHFAYNFSQPLDTGDGTDTMQIISYTIEISRYWYFDPLVHILYVGGTAESGNMLLQESQTGTVPAFQLHNTANLQGDGWGIVGTMYFVRVRAANRLSREFLQPDQNKSNGYSTGQLAEIARFGVGENSVAVSNLLLRQASPPTFVTVAAISSNMTTVFFSSPSNTGAYSNDTVYITAYHVQLSYSQQFDDILREIFTSANTTSAVFTYAATNVTVYVRGAAVTVWGRGEYSIAQTVPLVCQKHSHRLNTSGPVEICLCDPGFGGTGRWPTCTECAAGKYKPLPGDICQECARGKYGAERGATNETGCVMCPPDTYNSEMGGGACVDCPFRASSLSGSMSIQECQCEAGYTRNSEAQCVGCDRGKFKAAPGDTVCEGLCEFNSSSETGAVSAGQCMCLPGYARVAKKQCVACAKGKYKPEFGDTVCIDCLHGSYQDHEKSTHCEHCPALSNSSSAATGVASCLCMKGTTGSHNDTCEFCGVGKYKRDSGNHRCTPCVFNEHTIDIGADSDVICGYKFRTSVIFEITSGIDMISTKFSSHLVQTISNRLHINALRISQIQWSISHTHVRRLLGLSAAFFVTSDSSAQADAIESDITVEWLNTIVRNVSGMNSTLSSLRLERSMVNATVTDSMNNGPTNASVLPFSDAHATWWKPVHTIVTVLVSLGIVLGVCVCTFIFAFKNTTAAHKKQRSQGVGVQNPSPKHNLTPSHTNPSNHWYCPRHGLQQNQYSLV